MYALVVNGQITKYFNYPKGFELNGNQYPAQVFFKWSKAEKEAIGIYEVVTDSTNLKDTEYYINTNEQFAFANGAVTRSWGTATPKSLDDTGSGDTLVKGLKSLKKDIIKQQAAGLLSKTDWYVVKATEVADYSVPADITTYRAAVRTKSNEMETAIDNAADVDALKALYEYSEDGTRPLGEFPTEVV